MVEEEEALVYVESEGDGGAGVEGTGTMRRKGSGVSCMMSEEAVEGG